MSGLRPADLAREHGLSTQAIRNYERDGFLPAAERTPSGYRVYTELHAEALRAYLALVAAYGHGLAGRVMTGIHRDELDSALELLDLGHRRLLRDRETLRSVRVAVGHLTTAGESPDEPPPGTTRTIGELAHRLRVTPATLRAWESAGILAPARDPATGYRVYDGADTRDAELAHLLRRGGYGLPYIAGVVERIRTAGGGAATAAALDGWQRALTARGLAMLDAAGALGQYLRRYRPSEPEPPAAYGRSVPRSARPRS